MDVRRRIDVFGIVQGVGFRPHVHRLVRERGLTGTIANTAAGVAIEVQGPADAVADFVRRLPREAPPLARIAELAVRDLELVAEEGFSILPSRDDEPRRALIVPDVATCADCLEELADPGDRRHRYPFINCTNCGPRYTIVRDIPYDRPLTSMAGFPMCPACRAEYEDEDDRRFHAQATCCPECGPRLELTDREGRPVPCDDPLVEAAARLRDGAVVAIKGLGGFHLAADATNAEAVDCLRERKRRVGKPFAIMVRDPDTAAAICRLEEDDRRVLTGPEHPIVLLLKGPAGAVAEGVAPGNACLGVFLPYTPCHHLLLAEGDFRALVMTSGNLSEEPIACGNEEALRRLRGLADLFLVHDREILVRCDDSVVRRMGGASRPVRRSRGFVPTPLVLAREQPSVLAVGGELKNTVCLTKGRLAFVSQHVGDLENLETYEFFESTIRHLRRMLGIEPEYVAHDLHPDYDATRWALSRSGLPPIGVQHHHAHVAACMAEHGLDGPVIGVALDGTGYGTDGRIWGCEVLVCDLGSFERVAHLDPVGMPGGEAAIREPWRMAVAYLAKHFGRSFLARPVPFVLALDRRRTELVLRMLERDLNAPETSSCGRLFDAVAALLGVRDTVSYEAQAAIELESLLVATGTALEPYPFDLVADGDGWRIDSRPLFQALLDDIAGGVGTGAAARRFHDGLARVLARSASLLREARGIDRICLSGGSFQNAYLFERLEADLEADRFTVYSHVSVPSNDGGLSLGQAVVAGARARVR